MKQDPYFADDPVYQAFMDEAERLRQMRVTKRGRKEKQELSAQAKRAKEPE